MAKEMDPNEAVLTALRHPLRQRILKQLIRGGGTNSPKGIATELDTPLSNVSYHVRVLAQCDALKLVRTRPVRGTQQHFYKPSEKFMANPGVVAILRLTA